MYDSDSLTARPRLVCYNAASWHGLIPIGWPKSASRQSARGPVVENIVRLTAKHGERPLDDGRGCQVEIALRMVPHARVSHQQETRRWSSSKHDGGSARRGAAKIDDATIEEFGVAVATARGEVTDIGE